MATTTNYSWVTPDDTDLVKDGAAAIRTLGSSADTTVKDLNPGTTAGDIDYYTSSTAKARIAIGTAGQILTVNSGATAPEWATPATPPAPSFVGCMIFSEAGQTVSNNTFTAVAFAATDYLDTDGFHDPASNNTRITIPAGKGGKYRVFGQVRFSNFSSSPAQMRALIALNGTNFSETRGTEASQSALFDDSIMILTAGDYVELIALQLGGGNADLSGTTALSGVRGCRFGVEFLGA